MNKLLNSNLSVENHDRDVAGMTYVYPVVSRRAGGVSVGVNLNPNNACNWHCAYCQVPGLKRGVAPQVDLTLLRSELQSMLNNILNGDFMIRHVPRESRQLCDIAISGNGEPTSSAEFDHVVELIIEVMQSFQLTVPVRLITNGSYVHKPHVQRGLELMAENRGEVWVKVDAVDEAAVLRVNGIKLDSARLFSQVEKVAKLCPTWIQTCLMAWDNLPPSEGEIRSYIDFIMSLKQCDIAIQGVLLYGLARPSTQEEAKHIKPLDDGWMKLVAERVKKEAGVEVQLSL